MVELQLIDGDASANQLSPPVDMRDLRDFAIQSKYSGDGGTLNGLLTIQGSLFRSGPYVDHQEIVIEDSCPYLIAVDEAMYRYFRVKWTNTSGSGNITVKCVLKENFVRGT